MSRHCAAQPMFGHMVGSHSSREHRITLRSELVLVAIHSDNSRSLTILEEKRLCTEIQLVRRRLGRAPSLIPYGIIIIFWQIL